MKFPDNSIVELSEPVLVTGSNGFIGSRVVASLLDLGFRQVRCFVRPSSRRDRLEKLIAEHDHSAAASILEGNLLNADDCRVAADGVRAVYHLAAGIQKSWAGSFANSVVASRNLVEACLQTGQLRRFVNVSSLAVYSNLKLRRGALLDERCPVEPDPVGRQEAYAWTKLRQDELIINYGVEEKLPYVIVRPSVVFGPGKSAIISRVGIDTFGFFLHLGGSNQMPVTFVDNCAEAIVLAGLVPGIEGEVFNIVDDDLPTSCQLLRFYQRHLGRFFSIRVPYAAFFSFSWLWERYAGWSQGQLPPAFNRTRCSIYWKGNRYSNRLAKQRLGWQPTVGMDRALKSLGDGLREARRGVAA